MYLKQPTRGQRGPRIMSPYLVLLRVGFTLPHLLPVARCALTAPFHPYQHLNQLSTGGIFSAALSVGLHPPGVTWHSVLWSPDFPPQTVKDCLARLPGQLPAGILHYYSQHKTGKGQPMQNISFHEDKSCQEIINWLNTTASNSDINTLLRSTR